MIITEILFCIVVFDYNKIENNIKEELVCIFHYVI